MAATVVLLSARRPDVLSVAAAAALRGATSVVADATVPHDVAMQLGATRLAAHSGATQLGTLPLADDLPPGTVLVTTDPGRAGDQVLLPPAGTALLDAVSVMDRLRSPGGCPWDAEQTHASLLRYLVEECYELYDAVESGDRDAMREELGDVLLQVLFHARVAEEGEQAFTIDDVAATLVAKLVGRHPHVFAGTERIDTAARQERRWEELKQAEKQRTSSVDGVALAQPAVALAAKLTSRTARAGLPAELLPSSPDVGERLFALAAAAALAGADPEAELRTAALRFAEAVRRAERDAASEGRDPHALDAAAWTKHWPHPPG